MVQYSDMWHDAKEFVAMFYPEPRMESPQPAPPEPVRGPRAEPSDGPDGIEAITMSYHWQQ